MIKMSNDSLLALNLVAAAVSVSSADMDNLSSMAAQVVVDITAITGTAPTLVVTVEGKDPASGKYYPLIVSASLVAVSTTVLRVFPGATAAANLAVNDFVPKVFRVSATIAGTTPAITARISVNLNG
jgi:hypothetical protein